MPYYRHILPTEKNVLCLKIRCINTHHKPIHGLQRGDLYELTCDVLSDLG